MESGRAAAASPAPGQTRSRIAGLGLEELDLGEPIFRLRPASSRSRTKRARAGEQKRIEAPSPPVTVVAASTPARRARGRSRNPSRNRPRHRYRHRRHRRRCTTATARPLHEQAAEIALAAEIDRELLRRTGGRIARPRGRAVAVDGERGSGA